MEIFELSLTLSCTMEYLRSTQKKLGKGATVTEVQERLEFANWRLSRVRDKLRAAEIEEGRRAFARRHLRRDVHP